MGESAVDARWKAQSLPLPMVRDIEEGSAEDLVLRSNAAQQPCDIAPREGTCFVSGSEQ